MSERWVHPMFSGLFAKWPYPSKPTASDISAYVAEYTRLRTYLREGRP